MRQLLDKRLVQCILHNNAAEGVAHHHQKRLIGAAVRAGGMSSMRNLGENEGESWAIGFVPFFGFALLLVYMPPRSRSK